MSEREPDRWLDSVRLEGAEEMVRVTLEERRGSYVLVRQVDPAEPEPERIPIYAEDEIAVMLAISHVGIHSTSEVGNISDLVHSMRVVPVRQEGNVVYARSLRDDEPDDGCRVHIKPGNSVTVEEGALAVELDSIDAREDATESGYVPLTSVLNTWFSFGRDGRDDNAVRYLVAAARRLDMANEMLIRVRRLTGEIEEGNLPGPLLRRRAFEIVGCVELGMISLGRSVQMIKDAPARFKLETAIPSSLDSSYPALYAIRNAYEHIEDRAFGTVRGTVSDEALSIFDYSTLFREGRIVYGAHAFDISEQADRVLAESRATLKALVGVAIPPRLGSA